MGIAPIDFANFAASKQPLGLSFFHARSVKCKVDDLGTLFDCLGFSFDVIMLSETWYKDDSNVFSLPQYRHYSLCREEKRGGGVSLLIQNTLECELISEFTQVTENYELLCVRYRAYLFAVVHRPPSRNVSKFIDFFDIFCNFTTVNCYVLLLGGDYNINMLANTTARQAFMQAIDINGFDYLY